MAGCRLYDSSFCPLAWSRDRTPTHPDGITQGIEPAAWAVERGAPERRSAVLVHHLDGEAGGADVVIRQFLNQPLDVPDASRPEYGWVLERRGQVWLNRYDYRSRLHARVEEGP